MARDRVRRGPEDLSLAMNDSATVHRFHEQRAADLTRQADDLRRRLRTVEIARLMTFAAIIGVLVWALVRGVEQASGPWLVMAAVVVLFIVLIRHHSRLAHRERRMRDRALLSRAGMHRVQRAWKELPERDWTAPTGHPYAADL